MIHNRMGTIFENMDEAYAANQMQELIQNVYAMRTDMINSSLHSRKDINKECDYPETSEISVTNYKEMYDRNAVAVRVVDVFPEESWLSTPEIYEDEDTETETGFEKAFQELSKSLRGERSWFADTEVGSPIWDYLKRADKLAGIGHYGIIVLGIQDGKKLDEPAQGFKDSEGSDRQESVYVTNQEENGKANGKKSVKTRLNKLLYISVFDESCISDVTYETNSNSPRYRKPKTYTIDFGVQNDSSSNTSIGRTQQSIKVHWSRVVHICEGSDSSEVIGTPRQRPVWNNLLNLQKIYGGDAEGFWKNCVMRLFFETNPNLGGDVTVDNDALRDAVWNMENGLQRWMSLTGMSAKTVAPAVVDPRNHIDIQIEAICIKIGVPKRIFIGSERGELASGQDDSTWNDRVRSRQRNYIIPRLIVPFIDRLIQLQVLPEPDEGYRVVWPDPETLKPQEKAAIAVQLTDAMGKYIAGQVEALVDPLDYLTRFLDIEDDEARLILERAQEGQLERTDSQAELKDAKIEAGLMPDPAVPPPLEGEEEKEEKVPKGEEEEDDKRSSSKNEEEVLNAFCPTGKGGGVNPSCGSSSSSGSSGPLLDPKWRAKLDDMKIQVTEARTKLKDAIDADDKKGIQRGKQRLNKLYSTLGSMSKKYDDGQEGSGGFTAALPPSGGHLFKFFFGGTANQFYTEDQVKEWQDLLALNVFCPTGKGGGVKPTCGKGDKGGMPLREIKSLGGSTGAKLVEDVNTGKQYVKKHGRSPEQLREEFAADEGYRVAGIDVHRKQLVESDPPFTLAEFEPIAKDLGSLKGKERKDVIAKVQEGFAADALFANWDVIGLEEDNIMLVGSGKVLRIDNGGSLRFRAQGASKGSKFGPIVGELETMRSRTMAPEASKIFGKLQDKDIVPQIDKLYGKRAEILAVMPAGAKTIIAARLDYMKEWANRKRTTVNVFCPTGKGGGVDPTCGKGGSGSFDISGFKSKVGKAAGFTSSQLTKIAAINGDSSSTILVPLALNAKQVAAVKAAFPEHNIKKVNALKIMQKNGGPEKFGDMAVPGYSPKAPSKTKGKLKGANALEDWGKLKHGDEWKAISHLESKSQHAKFVINWKEGLSQNEKDAISMWKGSSSLIKKAEKGSSENVHSSITAKTFNSALDRAPKFNGTTFRGEFLDLQGSRFKALTSVGSVVEFHSSHSSSRSIKKARGFGSTIMRVRTKSGIQIERAPGGFKGEKEVVLRRGSKYRVINYAKLKGFTGESLHVIDMEEL